MKYKSRCCDKNKNFNKSLISVDKLVIYVYEIIKQYLAVARLIRGREKISHVHTRC